MADNDKKNIRALLGDEDLPLVEDKGLRFPAYAKMLENARQNYVRDVQAPAFQDIIAKSDIDTGTNRSEPTPLDKIADKTISKDFLNKLHAENDLKGADPEYGSIDRTAINGEVLKAYLRDENPTLAKHVTEIKEDDPDEFKQDNMHALFSQAKKLLAKEKNTDPDFETTEENFPAHGLFLGKGHGDNIILTNPKVHKDLRYLGQGVSTPSHELLHSIDEQTYGPDAPASGENITADFSKSNKLDLDIPHEQNRHIIQRAGGNVAPEEGLRYNPSVGESGVYFKKLRELIGKGIK